MKAKKYTGKQILPIEKPNRLAELVTKELDSNSNIYKYEISNFDKEIKDIHLRLECVFDAVETGKISLDDFAPGIHEFREFQQRLQTSIFAKLVV